MVCEPVSMVTLRFSVSFSPLGLIGFSKLLELGWGRLWGLGLGLGLDKNEPSVNICLFHIFIMINNI